MGALTSKPYAFTARPWELRSLRAVDCFDSFGSSLRVDVRGLDIMRVLPRVNESVNEEWITDRTRFSYDGLKCQRITQPLKRNVLQSVSYSRLNWTESFLEMIKSLLLSNVSNFNLIVGKLQTFNSFYSTLAFFNKLSNIKKNSTLNILYSEFLNSHFDMSFRSDYLLNDIEIYKKSDLIFFINTNLRIESPILNIRLRRLVLSRSVPVFSWGVYFDQTYNATFLGNSFFHLINLISGRHPLVKVLVKSSAPLLISSRSSNSSYLLAKALNSFDKLLKKFVHGTTNSYISSTTSSLMMFDYGLCNSKPFLNSTSPNKSNALLLLGDDEIVYNKVDYETVIYCGHHGDRNALNADLVLPTSFLFEEKTPIMNLLGLIETTEMVLNPPSKARSLFSIFNSFYLTLNELLNLSHIYSLQNLLTIKPYINLFLGFKFNVESSIKLTPFISSYLNIINFDIYILAGNEINSSYLFSYYSSNVVLRSSYVMALSKVRFQQYDTNFK